MRKIGFFKMSKEEKNFFAENYFKRKYAFWICSS